MRTAIGHSDMTERKTVTVDFSSVTGQIRPLHGMCNGPLTPGADLSTLFDGMGVPCVRFADTGGRTSGLYVDVSHVFPNPDADEYDPRSYRFGPTDTVVLAAAKSGAQVIYRLGESNDGWYFSLPENVEKWVRVCVNVIRHYNDGWADGHRLGLSCFEIWSAPDTMPDVGNAAVFSLYEKAAHGIKSYNPDLQVGGMGFADYGAMAREFIKFCKKKQLPLDFVSLCAYGRSPEQALSGTKKLVAYLQKSDMAHLPVLVCAWNSHSPEQISTSPAEKQAMIRELHSLPGAIWCAQMLLYMQEIPEVAMATYYDAQPEISPLCGICDRFGSPTKSSHAFRAFDMLYRQGTAVWCDVQGKGIAAAASRADRAGALMIAGLDSPGLVDIRLNNLPEDVYSADVLILDGVRDLVHVQTLPLMGMSRQIYISVSNYSLILIKLY